MKASSSLLWAAETVSTITARAEIVVVNINSRLSMEVSVCGGQQAPVRTNPSPAGFSGRGIDGTSRTCLFSIFASDRRRHVEAAVVGPDRRAVKVAGFALAVGVVLEG